MHLPKISIVTAVYNNASSIASSIDSTIGQSYENIELVIIDGGSSDGTLDIIRCSGSRYSYALSRTSIF